VRTTASPISRMATQRHPTQRVSALPHPIELSAFTSVPNPAQALLRALDTRRSLLIVTPDTVLRWQRRRFRDYWTRLSDRPNRGRLHVNAEIKALIARMAAANPLWGAPRIHGELLKLGIDVAERTVSRLIPNRRTPPSQTWQTSLRVRFHDFVECAAGGDF
jgi:hypothetical protein